MKKNYTGKTKDIFENLNGIYTFKFKDINSKNSDFDLSWKIELIYRFKTVGNFIRSY